MNRHQGFVKPDTNAANIEQKIRDSHVIPDELYFRWGPLIPIGPYTGGDHQLLAEQLGLGRESFNPEDAAQSGLNFRAIEMALSQKAYGEYRARRHARLTRFNS